MHHLFYLIPLLHPPAPPRGLGSIVGRRSYAYQILLKIPEDNESSSEGKVYVVVYDFHALQSIPPRFYQNLRRLQEFFKDGIQVQKSVIECARKRTALAIAELARLYGAKVRIYAVSDMVTLEG